MPFFFSNENWTKWSWMNQFSSRLYLGTQESPYGSRRLKSDRKNSWKQAKHVELYSDLLIFDSFGFPAQVSLIFASTEPHHRTVHNKTSNNNTLEPWWKITLKSIICGLKESWSPKISFILSYREVSSTVSTLNDVDRTYHQHWTVQRKGWKM